MEKHQYKISLKGPTAIFGKENKSFGVCLFRPREKRERDRLSGPWWGRGWWQLLQIQISLIITTSTAEPLLFFIVNSYGNYGICSQAC